MIETKEIRHGHMCCSIGAGAKGFNMGTARVGNLQAKWRCIGGVDVVPSVVRDFERLTGCPGTVLDLFTIEQYTAFHGKAPPPGWTEATPADIHRAFHYERPNVVFMSAPCLPANGLVLTEHGMRRIDSIRAGDRVLTHKGHYREVLKVGTEPYRGPMYGIRLNGTVDVQEFTSEHPMWRRRVIRRQSTSRKRALSEPEFVAAEKLRVGDRIGFPIDREDKAAASQFCSLYSSRHGLAQHADLPALWFVAGVYLGDGYRRSDRPDVAFAVGHGDSQLASKLREALAQLGIGTREEICGSRRNVKLWARDRDLWALLGAFGDGCANKDVPPSLMGLSLPLVEALIDGYRSSDGSSQGRRVARNTLQARWKIASVALPLLRSVQRLLLRTGTFASIHHCWPGGRQQVIEGRTVNTSQRWELNVRLDPKKRTVFEFEDGAVWVRIRSIRTRDAVEPVWNIEVDEDNTFCVPMMATHNCKGFSGLLSETRSLSAKYQALNQLALRSVWLVLEAYKDDPPEMLLFENVPRIATRGRPLLDQIESLLSAYGYASAETTHDCGELGGLAQSRKRFLLVARHIEKVPPFLYEPPKRPLRAVGDVLGKMHLPGDPLAGPMHRIPALHWKTWVRLAFVEAGKDWRSLQRLRVTDGVLQDFALVPECDYYPGAFGVNRPSNGNFAVADPRINGHHKSVQMGIRRWDEPAAAVTASSWAGTGPNSVADPRIDGVKHNNCFRVVRWQDVSPSVTGGTGPSAGGLTVADPRPDNDWAGGGKYRVTKFEETSGTVIAESGTGNGAFAVADPRPKLDPTKRDHYLTGGHYGVIPWNRHAFSVTGSGQHDNGYHNVADPRLPSAADRLVAVIRAEDNTWHRPFTTLELAALQSLFDPEDEVPFALEGTSDSAWREHIGNAVPPEAARAIADVIGHTLLLAWSGETFALGSTPIWVRPIAVALSVAQRKPT